MSDAVTPSKGPAMSSSQRPLSTICLAAIVLSVTLSVFLQSSPSRAAIEIETRAVDPIKKSKRIMLACTGVKERLIQKCRAMQCSALAEMEAKRGHPQRLQRCLDFCKET